MGLKGIKGIYAVSRPRCVGTWVVDWFSRLAVVYFSILGWIRLVLSINIFTRFPNSVCRASVPRKTGENKCLYARGPSKFEGSMRLITKGGCVMWHAPLPPGRSAPSTPPHKPPRCSPAIHNLLCLLQLHPRIPIRLLSGLPTLLTPVSSALTQLFVLSCSLLLLHPPTLLFSFLIPSLITSVFYD